MSPAADELEHRAARRVRRWATACGVAVVVLLGTWVGLQVVIEHDCRAKQAAFGFQGCVPAPDARPWLDWSSPDRRSLLFAVLRGGLWLRPFATGDDVRRGAAQFLIESARGEDAPVVAALVAEQRLDPEFGALHFALACSDSDTPLPSFLFHELDGPPHEQYFALLTLSMVTGIDEPRWNEFWFDPVTGDAAHPDWRSSATAHLRATPAAIAAEWKARSADPTARCEPRPRVELLRLLDQAPRSCSLF